MGFVVQCLNPPTGAIARGEKEEVMEFLVAAGLDQGAWFSPVAFAATLPLGSLQRGISQSQPEAQTKRPVSGRLSFLDDLTLAAPRAAARPARQIAEAAMSDVGLWLNMSKCMVKCTKSADTAFLVDGDQVWDSMHGSAKKSVEIEVVHAWPEDCDNRTAPSVHQSTDLSIPHG